MSTLKRIGILCTHPIQYYSPLFRLLTKRVDLTVYYCVKPTPEEQGRGFGVSFQWDIDLLSGYPFMWLKNVASRPRLDHFEGCDTPEIASIIGRQKFDAFLVLGWNRKSFWQAMRACWKSGTPVLVRGDSHLHGPSSPIKKIAKKLLYPFFVQKFDACLAVGKWSAEYFRHYGARRVFMSPHFVDNARFASGAVRFGPDRSRIRTEWNLPGDAVVFMFAGKFEDKKRPTDLLLALRNLAKRRKTGFGLLMVGDGAWMRPCQVFAEKNNLPARFAGFLNQNQMPKAYGVSDVFVLPSDGRETWGLSVNEAMASGLPAIVSDQVGCGPDLIKDGQTGFVFPCGEVGVLADRMERFLNGASVEMGKKAADHVGLFTAARAADGILEAIGGTVR